mmetsp:Transcript_40037/g.95616  ORF Transcript_40037/g.95616 Transcript_40037/m.95616 type:complete len:184 (+) Transcript_40037:26-577(+)
MGHAVGEATRRAVEPVRRVTARPGSSPVAASSWEHVEVVLAEDAEVVSSLVLEQDSTFRAQVFSRSGEQAKLKPLEPEQPTLGPERQAFGCWRPCGKGVELVLAEEVDLGLEELVILYRHRRGCLVAEETSLPDGLAQEYSRCAPESEAAGATLNSVPEACCSPRSEVYEDDFEDDSEPEHQQ